MWLNDLFGFSLFGTQKHGKPDYATLKSIDQVTPIVYPKPDGVLTFDKFILGSFFPIPINEEDQPIHLEIERSLDTV